MHQELKERLKRLESEENYEQCAKLRDFLTEIEKPETKEAWYSESDGVNITLYGRTSIENIPVMDLMKWIKLTKNTA